MVSISDHTTLFYITFKHHTKEKKMTSSCHIKNTTFTKVVQ